MYSGPLSKKRLAGSCVLTPWYHPQTRARGVGITEDFRQRARVLHETGINRYVLPRVRSVLLRCGWDDWPLVSQSIGPIFVKLSNVCSWTPTRRSKSSRSRGLFRQMMETRELWCTSPEEYPQEVDSAFFFLERFVVQNETTTEHR